MSSMITDKAEATKKPPEGGGGSRTGSVIYRMWEALFRDRPEALCLERGSRDNVGDYWRPVFE